MDFAVRVLGILECRPCQANLRRLKADCQNVTAKYTASHERVAWHLQYIVSSKHTSHVPMGLYISSRFVSATTGIWQSLGRLESRMLRAELADIEVEQPIFISGVARSGSTILTEIISRHAKTTSHHYSDFPLTWTPYWWNHIRNGLSLPESEQKERAHRDRLMINSDSPEAIEEVLWQNAFPQSHALEHHHVLGEDTTHPRFEQDYRQHIRKLLAIRQRQRYVTKNNYHATRLEYLLRLFPDARFIIPVRHPVQQVASLIKQHRLFSRQDGEDPRVSRQLQMAGHYEFGPRRCPIITEQGQQSHYRGQTSDVAWYGQQWADIYAFLGARLAASPALAKASLVVNYEALCSDTRESLQQIFRHVGLGGDAADAIIESVEPTISAPDYYTHDFSAEDLLLLHELTAATAERFGYRL